LDLLSGCCSLHSLGLREASIPFSCLSNAIICDLKRRMSSIRRSSLISITLGLLAVIGAIFRSLMRRQDSASLETRRVGWVRAGLVVGGPARFGSYRNWPIDESVVTVRAACRASASVAVTAVTSYAPSTPSFLDDQRSVKWVTPPLMDGGRGPGDL